MQIKDLQKLPFAMIAIIVIIISGFFQLVDSFHRTTILSELKLVRIIDVVSVIDEPRYSTELITLDQVKTIVTNFNSLKPYQLQHPLIKRKLTLEINNMERIKKIDVTIFQTGKIEGVYITPYTKEDGYREEHFSSTELITWAKENHLLP